MAKWQASVNGGAFANVAAAVTGTNADSNVRHITVNPELSDRYAYDFTPNELQRPITARSIAN